MAHWMALAIFASGIVILTVRGFNQLRRDLRRWNQLLNEEPVTSREIPPIRENSAAEA